MITLRAAIALLLIGGVLVALGMAASGLGVEQQLAILGALIVVVLALIGFDWRRQ